jgi:tetratricopeptide (TPR) repeat protein
MADSAQLPLITRLLARWWYLWGLSVCYTASRTHDRGLFRAGVASFGRALRLAPSFAEAYYQRGSVCGRELGAYEPAVADLSRAIELDPAWPDPYLQRGLLYRFNGNPAAARADLAQYLVLAPEGAWRDEAARQLAALEDEGN